MILHVIIIHIAFRPTIMITLTDLVLSIYYIYKHIWDSCNIAECTIGVVWTPTLEKNSQDIVSYTDVVQVYIE